MSILRLVVTPIHSLLKTRCQLVLENLALQQQVTMLRLSVMRSYPGNKPPINPTDSTNPSPAITPVLFHSITGVESVRSIGCKWSFTRGYIPYCFPVPAVDGSTPFGTIPAHRVGLESIPPH